jgi:Fe-S-cluster containining protein
VPRDRELIQIIDTALADAARKAGRWLVCRPGCCECCLGPFSITAADAARLREGLAELDAHDARRADRVRSRAGALLDRLRGGLAEEDEPCPALDPESGTCDLYQARPITCRTFGPPVRCADGGVAICELCFDGASEEEIAACTVDLDVSALLDDAGETTVALALAAFKP